MQDHAQLLRIDVERRTTRGRSCPRCGGKIIPSRQAVFQSTGDPDAVFPAWQCERCGYEELIARPAKAASKHGAAAGEKKGPEKKASASTSTPGSSVAAPATGVSARVVPTLKDRKGRDYPPDVNRMLAEWSRGTDPKE